MKDILQDIVSHTQNLGFLTTVKITGTDKGTTVNSMAEDRSVIMEAETANPYPDMLGVFGMPQLQKLKYLLDGSEYKDNAKISITTADRNGETLPVGLHFENKDGDFKNDYRFMSTEIINEKMKTVKFRGVKWDVEVEPTVNAVQRGEFIFAQNVAGKLDRGWTWPVAQILSILKIADVNNTKMSLSNEGAIQITLDSGLATYKYIIPAQAA